MFVTIRITNVEVPNDFPNLIQTITYVDGGRDNVDDFLFSREQAINIIYHGFVKPFLDESDPDDRYLTHKYFASDFTSHDECMDSYADDHRDHDPQYHMTDGAHDGAVVWEVAIMPILDK